ncbi:MAG: NAD-dependent epimerase/dehydratase family protein [Planctomycetaceae bacterium]|nr:NAD-dependent epimerase/dehydratase family protein [Planctomycetaceae bacterium]
MQWTDKHLLLITGATGLVGSHVAEEAAKRGIRVRALVRQSSKIKFLQKLGVEWVSGGMTEPFSLKAALNEVTHVVHCAAMVGDWGDPRRYHEVNVTGLESFLEAARECDTLQRFVHISSLGVYPVRDHHGTDESSPTSTEGIDGYTKSKVEAEGIMTHYVDRENVPCVALRPGFIYGPRDKTVLPRIITRLRDGKASYIGDGETKLNNTYVKNLVDAIFLALERNDHIGEFFNIRDETLVTKKEFFETIARFGGLPLPKREIPLGAAKAIATGWEFLWRAINMDSPPPLSQATVKFLGYNLDYSIHKAKKELVYKPQVDFKDAIQTTLEWYRKKGRI